MSIFFELQFLKFYILQSKKKRRDVQPLLPVLPDFLHPVYHLECSMSLPVGPPLSSRRGGGTGGRGGEKGIILGILLIDCSHVQGVSVQSIIIIVCT